MDQDSLVTDQIDEGGRIVEELRRTGFDVTVAFWARPADENKWFLYIVSPLADRDQARAARTVYTVVRQPSNGWIDPFDVRVVGPGDSMAAAAAEKVRPMAATGPFAVVPPKPHRGMTRFNGSSLGGVSVAGAYIYPPA